LADRLGSDGRHDRQLDEGVGQQAQRPARPPRGRVATGQSDQARFRPPIEPARLQLARVLVLQGTGQAVSREAAANAPDGRQRDLDGCRDLRITQTLVGFQEDAGVGQLARGRRAGADQVLELVAFIGGQVHRIFAHALSVSPPLTVYKPFWTVY